MRISTVSLAAFLALAAFGSPASAIDVEGLISRVGNPCNRADVALGQSEELLWQDPARLLKILEDARRDADACDEPRAARLRAETLYHTAEALKVLGSVQAGSFYEKAIAAQPDNALYEIGYGEYLRSFRGPLAPLFPEAELHFYRGRGKLPPGEESKEQNDRITRALTALYERDGVPLFWSDMLPFLPDAEERRPLVFLSTQNRFDRSFDETGQQDEVRDLTNSALFMESAERRNMPLDRAELRSLIEPRRQFETVNRLRFRYRWLPVVDVQYSLIDSRDAQITSFDFPGRFNDVEVSGWQVGVERTFALYPLFDALLRIDVGRGEREGLIEGNPKGEEDVDSVAAVGVFTRFVGTNKLVLDVRYTKQNIDQQVKDPIARDLEIVGATFRLQRFPPAAFRRAVAPRESELFIGAALGQETFGKTKVNRDDYFLGVALRGLPVLEFSDEPTGKLDLVVQPTIYHANRSGRDKEGARVASLSNSQYRTVLTGLYRLIDHENDPRLEYLPSLGSLRLATLNLVVPLAHDVAIENTSAYDGFSLGVEVTGKVIGDLSTSTRYRGATALATLGYEYQRFYHLDHDEHLARVALRLGF